MRSKHWDRLGNGGLTFTELGFGGAPLGNLYREITEEQARATLESAWDVGIRYFDTAPLYGVGLSETRLNGFLRGKKRSDYVLASKVGRMLSVTSPEKRWGEGILVNAPSRAVTFDYRYDAVMRSLETSFERLGVDSIDILYVHNLDMHAHGSKEATDEKIDELMNSGYRALIELRDQGVVKAIGCGIDDWEPAQTLVERGDFDIILLAGRYTLLEQGALQTFLPLCERRGVGVVIGGVYNSGILATGPTARSYYDYVPATAAIKERVSKIEAVCSRHGVKLVEAALKFPLMHSAVLCVLAGAQSPAEVTRNRAVLDIEIPAALWADLKSEGLIHPDAPTD
ncbi:MULTISPECIES: aldo/keto reductase [unclassified Mesorhizobium]|uniref:aldo/keto reductase n=1 Tax=unclassified Mesorhizobium TaxID=325217 RepID=UPI000FDCD7EA|nr:MULTISPECIES: aldo/keto reductase [unclassified Mesorhizobium]TGR23192.1 aldo/keto reductase [Mesorhizobium sp. M8A.F.Ca.ET.197.01.1.1]TGR39273.1 aldo/keto reductase [bacterium M00.F.Ca.ET.199.01.1.1]TGR46870.1 aldo/keto reductase [Mesorhizobium sp. M8A.F.Ca.ET.198.01.1.1]TGV85330.1 aldo/keto reductase [Mesorhizobium sp. M00.F.Ca.ET.149.01.1.1]